MEGNRLVQDIDTENKTPDETVVSRRSALAVLGVVGLGAALGGIGKRSFAKSKFTQGAELPNSGSNIFEGNGGSFGFTQNEDVTIQVIEQVNTSENSEGSEQPKEEKKEAAEKPANHGMDIFKQMSLPSEVVKRLENENVLGRVNNQIGRYKHAEKATGVPWQIMAAIHYREGGVSPNKSLLDGSPLDAGISMDGLKINPNAKRDAEAAANHLKSNAKNIYGINLDKIDELPEEDIANAILTYNRGSMYKSAQISATKSPYINNFRDGKAMGWTAGDVYYKGKRMNKLEIGSKDGNVGAFVIIAYLMQNA